MSRLHEEGPDEDKRTTDEEIRRPHGSPFAEDEFEHFLGAAHDCDHRFGGSVADETHDTVDEIDGLLREFWIAQRVTDHVVRLTLTRFTQGRMQPR